MEEIELGPECVFQEMGMLVLESRVPESSDKGHVEGPHCPTSLGENNRHQCDQKQRNVSNSEESKYKSIMSKSIMSKSIMSKSLCKGH